MNWQQLKAVLWLRWRLTRNQWSRNGSLGAVLAAIVAAAALVMGGVSFVGALLGGMLGLGEAKPTVVWAIWLGLTVVFLFFWMVGLMAEIQRSESIDLQRLMHLPVALGQMFVINYLASHLAFSIVLIVPAMLGLAIGLTISRGPAMLLLGPLALGMIFMITAWTYCLRGWLGALMSNPRRRRSVIMGITLGFVLLSQAPNLYFNVFHRWEPSPAGTSGKPRQRGLQVQVMVSQFRGAQKFIPPLWLPLGARGLAEGRATPALLGTLGCFAIGALGLRRAYRGTVRFYHGDAGGKAARQPPAATRPAAIPAKCGSRFLELRLPGVPEQAAALALATFRSMLRAPEVKMAWASSFFVTLIAGGSLLFRAAPKVPEAAKPFLATGAVVFSIFMLVQFIVNQFGFDRDGFRALILSPANRRLVLLGKNLACLPAGVGFSVVLLAVISVWLKLPPTVVLAALFQLVTMLLLAGLAGNLLSILAPYRIQPGSMKPTKMPALATLVMVLCHLLFPLAMAPVFAPPLAGFLWQKLGWPKAVPVNLLLSAGMAALAMFAYWQTLEPLGRLLQRRETRILGIVTVEVD
jgi:hypothetical protein